MGINVSRRQVMVGGVLGAAGLIGETGGDGAARASVLAAGAHPESDPIRKRVLRVAHLTDAHVNGDNGSDRGFARCLEHIQTQRDKVNLILNTGDTVMCVNQVDEASAKKQWGIVTGVLKDHLSIPIVHAIGNHDLWGWEPSKEDPRRATGMVREALGMPGRFYRETSLDRRGWTFISLDSIFGAYTGKLDDEQFEFLAKTLAEIPPTLFVCILTHIPIISACGLFDGERFKGGQWSMPGSWMHEDASKLKELFAKHRNVKLCLSGHMHQLDRIDFQGVTYLCSGAVSASWWGGKYYDCDYGYSLVDLFDDGYVEYRYVMYGWPQASAK